MLITIRSDDCFVLQKVSRVIVLGSLADADAVLALTTWSGRQPSNSQESGAAKKLSVESPIEKLPIPDAKFPPWYQLVIPGELRCENIGVFDGYFSGFLL